LDIPKLQSLGLARIKIGYSKNKDWKKATDIFLDRINGRFLNPIEVLENNQDDDIWEFSGFAIIGLDCLLIETLNQFYKGIDETTGEHWKAFWRIFKNSPYFKDEFDRSKKAHIFYSHFRCGILHQAQTKRKSKIRIDEPNMIIQINENDINEGLIVNRKLFHEALKNEINYYVKKLKNPKTRDDYILREKFMKKMKIITNP